SRSARSSTVSTSATSRSSRTSDMDTLLVVLAIPLLGSLVLAACGHRPLAPALNIAFSAATFAASVLLTARVIESGPQFALGQEFFVDSLNVFLVALTTF